MTIYDPISKSLGLPPIDIKFNIDDYKHDHCSVPAWNSGKPHMQKENHPLWGKKHKPETIEKMRQKRLGYKWSSENKKKMSETRKGKIPNGCSMKGKNHTEETKVKISESSKGFSDKTREMQRQYMIGKKLPESWTSSLSQARAGKRIYNNGQISKMFNPNEVEHGFVLGKLKKGKE